jgi:mRNA interferase RelE/StbE
MVYEVKFKNKPRKFFNKLQKEEKKQIVKKLERIRINPESYLIKLINSNSYKLIVGDFKLFIDLYKNELVVLVIKIGKRKNVYNR